jgi:hypothetical protein
VGGRKPSHYIPFSKLKMPTWFQEPMNTSNKYKITPKEE